MRSRGGATRYVAALVMHGASGAQFAPCWKPSRAALRELLSFPSHGLRLWGSILDATVVPTVTKVNEQADNQPYDQPRPIDPAQLQHHVAVEEYPQDRHERHQRRVEGARLARVGLAQDNH